MKKFKTLTFFLFLFLTGFAQELTYELDDQITISQKNGKYGAYSYGELIIPFQYDNIGSLYPCQLLGVIEDKKFGILDYSGQIIKPLEYNRIVSLSRNTCLIGLEKDNNLSLLDEKGNLTDLFNKYTKIKSVLYDSLLMIETAQNKLGLINFKGQEIIPAYYDDISLLKKDILKVTKEGKRGLIDIYGKEYSDQNFDFITLYRYKKNIDIEELILAERGEESGIIDSLGRFYNKKLDDYDSDAQYLRDNIIHYIQKYLEYPDQALENEIGGNIVISFKVEKDGTLSNFTSRGTKLGYGLEEEVIRVLKKTSGNWQPAIINGKITSSIFRLPVTFRLPPE